MLGLETNNPENVIWELLIRVQKSRSGVKNQSQFRFKHENTTDSTTDLVNSTRVKSVAFFYFIFGSHVYRRITFEITHEAL
jgi:hypothetical protein